MVCAMSSAGNALAEQLGHSRGAVAAHQRRLIQITLGLGLAAIFPGVSIPIGIFDTQIDSC